MSTPVVTTLRACTDSRSQVGESPCWHADARALYWVDVWSCCVRRWLVDAAVEDAVFLPEMVGAVLLQKNGKLLALLETAAFELEFGTPPVRLSAPADLPSTHRFNDAVIDPRGRLIAGTMRKSQLGPEPTGSLYVFDGAEWRTLLTGFWTVNGLAFSPDGGVLYVSDSHPSVRTVWACEYDPLHGRLGQRRTFVDMTHFRGRPDGAAVDVEGCYWIAGVSGGCIYRFSPQGDLLSEIALPVENPTKVAFGGDALRTLYITSMSVRTSRADPLAGAVLETPVDVSGQPQPLFESRVR